MSIRLATKRSLEHLGSEQDAKKAKENEGDDVHTAAAPKGKAKAKPKAKGKPAAKKAVVDEAEDLFNDEDSDSNEKAAPAPKKKATPRKAPAKKVVDKSRDSEEEGVSSDSDDSEDDGGEFNDGFDEKMFGDEEDRKMLMEKTQFERERILSDRYERRKILKERWEAKHQDAQKGGKGKKKAPSKAKGAKQSKKAPPAKKPPAAKGKRGRKARVVDDSDDDDDDDDDDEEEEEPVQSKVAEVVEEEMEVEAVEVQQEPLVPVREEAASDEENLVASEDESSESEDETFRPAGAAAKKPKKKGGRLKKGARGSESDDTGTPPSSEDEDELIDSDDDDRVGRNRKSASKKEKEPEKPPLDLDAANRLRIPRESMVRWVDEPHFNDLVVGSFVRISVGSTTFGQATYRMVRVADIEINERSYKVENVTTKKRLVVAVGGDRKTFKIMDVSNSKITQSELDFYIKSCIDSGYKVMGVEEAASLYDKRVALHRNFQYDDATIAEMVNKKKMNVPIKNVKNLVTKRNELENQLLQLKTRGVDEDAEEFTKIKDEIKEVDDEDDRRKGSAQARAAPILNINKKAEQFNTHDYLENIKKKQMEAAILKKQGIDLEGNNPHAHRPTRAIKLFAGAQKDPEAEERAKAAANSAAKVVKKETARIPLTKEDFHSFAGQTISSSLDQEKTPVAPIAPAPVQTTAYSGPRSGKSLKEYLQEMRDMKGK